MEQGRQGLGGPLQCSADGVQLGGRSILLRTSLGEKTPMAPGPTPPWSAGRRGPPSPMATTPAAAVPTWTISGSPAFLRMSAGLPAHLALAPRGTGLPGLAQQGAGVFAFFSGDSHPTQPFPRGSSVPAPEGAPFFLPLKLTVAPGLGSKPFCALHHSKTCQF